MHVVVDREKNYRDMKSVAQMSFSALLYTSGKVILLKKTSVVKTVLINLKGHFSMKNPIVDYNDVESRRISLRLYIGHFSRFRRPINKNCSAQISSPISRHRHNRPTLSFLYPFLPHIKSTVLAGAPIFTSQKMSLSDDEDECFARFLESEVSSVYGFPRYLDFF